MATPSPRSRADVDRREPRSPYVTVKEFAAHWSVSERTVLRDLQKGAIPFRRVGRFGRIRILRSVMEAYGKPHE